MKKKLNYYEVHLNKKPKRLVKKNRKYKSTIGVKLALNMASSAMQTSIIQSQPFKEYGERAKAIIEVINNNIKTTLKICKEEKQIRFNKTKRYIK